MLPDFIIKKWTEGLVTRVKGNLNTAKDMLNWHVNGDHIALRRGYEILGNNTNSSEKVTGLATISKLDGDGTQVLLWSHGRKLKTYDKDTDTHIEIGSDLLPVQATNEDISIEPYYSLAGSAAYLSSPNLGILKVMAANPTSYVDLDSKTYKGRIKIKNGAMFLWNRKDAFGGSDRTGLYRSKIDKDELSDYSYTEKETLATGNGVLTSFSGDLDQLVKSTAANAKRTGMYVRIAAPKAAAKTITAITKATNAQITSTAHGYTVGDIITIQGVSGMTEINGKVATVRTTPTSDTFTVDVNSTAFTNYTSGGSAYKAEIFMDDRAGNLTAQSGSTTAYGTVNYVTGAITLITDIAVPNAANIVADYYYEDSTNGGIADFSYSGTRLAGEGVILRQDDKGYAIQNIFTLEGEEYVIHSLTAWKTVFSADDESISNRLWNPKIGMKYHRSGTETAMGIVYVDSTDPNEPVLRKIQISDISIRAKPVPLSEKVDLSVYNVDTASIYEWGNYIIANLKSLTSTTTDRMLIYNKLWKSIEIHDLSMDYLTEYEGGLVGGSAISPNLYKIFSGVTDEEIEIPNFYETGYDDLGYPGVKVTNRGVIKGLIDKEQELDVEASFDNKPYVKVATVSGKGSYVDLGNRQLIGPSTLGTTTLGGDGNGLVAYPYELEFRMNTDRYTNISIRYTAKKIGYVSVSEFSLKDNRKRARRISSQYVVNP